MKISVIIPAYNEAQTIIETVTAVEKNAGGPIAEVLVVDGGSTDDTVAKAETTTARVVQAPRKGRAAQMNYGAKLAEGELLYFLHADSIPPTNYDQQLIKAVETGYSAGCFQLTFDDNHWLLKTYAWFTRFDIDAFRFGDQSLFVESTFFEDIGGFREDHLLMEDNEIVRRIKREIPFAILDDVVITSARSYRKVGVVKLQLVFLLIYVSYFLGVEQEQLLSLKENALR